MSNKVLSRFIAAAFLFILTVSLAYAWTPGLKEAAEAVARGTALPEQEMMVFVNNKELNLLAQEGKITEYTYASCQDDFFRLNQDFANKAVRDAGFDPSISNPKLNPGTDTDVNVLGGGGKKVTLTDIQNIETNYQNNVKKYFQDKGLRPPEGPINTETDFMPHPAHTDPREFQKIVKYVNQHGGTAYADPRAAAAQAKLGSTQPIRIDEASSFSSTMKDMADAKIAKANKLRSEAQAIRGSNPGRAEHLEAQARQYDYQASKYHDRIEQLDAHLRNQHGLPPRKGQTPFDKAMENINKIGRNPFSGKDAATIRSLHQNGLQRSADNMIDTLLEIAKKDPARAAEITRALAKEVNSLPANRAGQAISRIEQAGSSNLAKAVVTETKYLKQAASVAGKWASFKETMKDLSGIKSMTKLSVVMTAGGAILMGHQGVTITLDNVKATDTLWDYFRDCYYHAAWEGTGIGPAFDQAQREEIERYMKEFEAGQSPNMVKHITFTILKTGAYMGRDAIIGLLYLPDTVWEYFTQEKELEGYAAMQNELARVMRQMIQDRKDFEQLMAKMRKMGLHDEDAKLFLDCLCRGCGGMLGGLYNPGFVTDIGHGPCQCNGPLTIWKTPLPVGNKQAQYDCFNAVTKMRHDQAQDIFDKWHKQMLDANARSVEEDVKAIKQDIANKKAMENEDVARDLSDKFNGIKDLMYPDDVDFVRATVGPYLENHATRTLEAGNIPRAIDDLDRVLNKIGTRHPQQDVDLKQRKDQYKKWDVAWRETKDKHFPKIDEMIGKNQPRRAAWEIENLEYKILKDPTRPLPPAIKDPAFLRLKERVADLGKRYNQAVRKAWDEATVLEKDRDRRAAIPILERVLKEWEHSTDQADGFKRQIAYDQGEVRRAEEKIALGRHHEAAGNLTAAITQYTESLEIQKDEGLAATVQNLKRRLAETKPPVRDTPVSVKPPTTQTLPITPTTPSTPSDKTSGGQAQGGITQITPPVNGLGTVWDKLSAVGGNFDRFARFEGSVLVVDVPANNHWGKTGIMAKQPMFKLGKAPVTVTVRVDPSRTTGLTVAFAASSHPDVALINNAWMSWVRNDDGVSANAWIGNVQDSWAGRSPGTSAKTSAQAPTPFVLILEPGRFSLRLGNGERYTTAIPWLKEGTPIYPHIFSHPTSPGKPAKFALAGLDILTVAAPGTGKPVGGDDRPTSSDTPTGAPPVAQGTVAIDTGNIGGVGNAPTQPTQFTLNEPRVLTLIQDYHWNNGRGATPGTIGLIDGQGRRYGPWGTTGSPGQGGVPNAYWTARPQVELPAGSYTVIDSDPGSWAQNSQSGGRGFTRVETLPVGGDTGYTGGRGYTGQPGITGGAASTAPASTATVRVILEIGNTAPVANRPDKASKFDLDEPHVITLIRTYHWNDGRGAAPGSISLRCRDGQNFGPWQAVGGPGPGGVANAYWSVSPNVGVPATTCSIVDSDPATWSRNEDSKGRGFSRVEGYPAGAGKPLSSTPTATPRPPGQETSKLEKALGTVDKVDSTMKKIEKLLDILK